jgi:hypothetical protein
MAERYQGAWGLPFSVIKGACDAAYAATVGQTFNFGNAGMSWNVVRLYQSGGFRAIVLEWGSTRIVSYAGTEMTSIRDWGNNAMQQVVGISPQYSSAQRVAIREGNSNTVLVGHSLGGGLASYASLATNVPAATINPAPLHLAGQLGTRIAGGNLFGRANVVNYVARGGEVLDLLDMGSPTVNRVGRDIYIDSTSGNPIGKHMLGNIRM